MPRTTRLTATLLHIPEVSKTICTPTNDQGVAELTRHTVKLSLARCPQSLHIPTHQNGQRSRPRCDISGVIQVHLVIRAEEVQHEVRHSARWTWCATKALEAENDLQDLRGSLHHEVYARAAVEACALELIAGDGASWIDLVWVREIVGL